MSIHHVDLLIPAVFFACLINKSLAGRIKAPTLGLFLFIIFFISQFFTGFGAPDELWIRSWFSIWAHFRMILFFYCLSELLKIDHLRISVFRIMAFLIMLLVSVV